MAKGGTFVQLIILSDFLAIFPLPRIFQPCSLVNLSMTVLFTVSPVSVVSGPIYIEHLSFSMPFVILKLSFVILTICPFQDPESMHLVFSPLPVVLPTILPYILSQIKNKLTSTMDLIVCELAFIITFVLVCHNSSTVLEIVLVLPDVNLSILPSLPSLSLLFPIVPLSLKEMSTFLSKFALSVVKIIFPITLIRISIAVLQYSVSILLIVFEIALVSALILPNLDSIAVSHGIQPLTIVFNANQKLNRLQFDRIVDV